MLKFNKFDVLIAPLYSEKATHASALGKYVFKVAKSATKSEVKKAVEQLFNTKVDSVNILTTKRKAKVFKGRQGFRSNFKKAIVTLEKGKTIDLAVGA